MRKVGKNKVTHFQRTETNQPRRQRTGLPSLRSTDGTWAHVLEDKANLFAESVSRKYQLPPEIEDIDVGDPVAVMNEFVAIRTRSTLKILKNLREDQATGPDKLAARVLRRCASQLARPITLLARRIFDDGVWPKIWKQHWISPLHKRGSVYDPDKYRGLHLTPVVSKVVERCFAVPLSTFCEESCAFGRTQWAFQKKIGFFFFFFFFSTQPLHTPHTPPPHLYTIQAKIQITLG